jgi:hypothetical protein
MMALIILAVVVVLLGFVLWRLLIRSPPSALEDLDVKPVYPKVTILPKPQIEAYKELKEKLRPSSASKQNDTWMSLLPAQDKDRLKYFLMQRAIGDMASLQKIDADARGYWRLFTKGYITRRFWDSVIEVEKELSQELENVKLEAQNVEPNQDPQGIISEAMRFIMRCGDRLPSAAEIASSADAITELMRQAAPGGGLPPGMPGPPGMPPGMPGMPPMPPDAMARVPQKGGGTDECNWTQNTDEVEVVVLVPKTATKKLIKVDIQKQALKCSHNGDVLVQGKLGGGCDNEVSTWTLEPGRLIVTLQKLKPQPWATLFLS